MKIKGEFVLRTVAGEIVALPYSGVTNLDMMITLNETGKFLWEKLVPGAEREELIDALLAEYDVDYEKAGKCVDSFVARLKELDFLE